MAKQLLCGLTQKHTSAPHSHCVRWIFWEVLRSALGARRSLKLKSWPLQVSNEIPPFREPTSPAILRSSVAHTRARRGSHCEDGGAGGRGSIPVERISSGPAADPSPASRRARHSQPLTVVLEGNSWIVWGACSTLCVLHMGRCLPSVSIDTDSFLPFFLPFSLQD